MYTVMGVHSVYYSHRVQKNDCVICDYRTLSGGLVGYWLFSLNTITQLFTMIQ